MSDHYRPIDCNLHSQYELYIMHKELLRMAWLDEQGQEHIDLLTPKDMSTELGAEYMVCENGHHLQMKIRLDRIVRATPMKEV
ncbi:MAG TPA: transcriptional antiterminator, Rof [Gammaproteobacteria bacterium]